MSEINHYEIDCPSDQERTGAGRAWVAHVRVNGTVWRSLYSQVRFECLEMAARSLATRIIMDGMVPAKLTTPEEVMQRAEMAQEVEHMLEKRHREGRPAGQVEDWVKLAPPAPRVEDGGGL